MKRRKFVGSMMAASLLSRVTCQISRSKATVLPKVVDIAAESGIHFHCKASHTSQKYLIESMVGGVAMFDSNGDGNLDLFFVNGAELVDPMPKGKMPDSRTLATGIGFIGTTAMTHSISAFTLDWAVIPRCSFWRLLGPAAPYNALSV